MCISLSVHWGWQNCVRGGGFTLLWETQTKGLSLISIWLTDIYRVEVCEVIGGGRGVWNFSFQYRGGWIIFVHCFIKFCTPPPTATATTAAATTTATCADKWKPPVRHVGFSKRYKLRQCLEKHDGLCFLTLLECSDNLLFDIVWTVVIFQLQWWNKKCVRKIFTLMCFNKRSSITNNILFSDCQITFRESLRYISC